MPSVTARDIMIPLDQYPHIPHWFTLRQAVVELEKSVIDFKGKSSLPRALLVFHEEYQLVGIVRRRDILRGLEPKFLRTMPIKNRRQLYEVEGDINLLDLSSGHISQEMQRLAETKVSEIMLPVVETVGADAHLAKIIHKMITRDLNLVPVIDGDKVVGVVRSVDVFHEIGKMLIEQDQDKSQR